MIVADTSALLALLDRRADEHSAVDAFVASNEEPFLLSPFVLAELDYMVSKRIGLDAELALLEEVFEGAYLLVEFTNADVGASRALIQRYRDLKVGLTDASIVVLAERYETNRVLTLDERHFRTLRANDKEFVVLPADA